VGSADSTVADFMPAASVLAGFAREGFTPTDLVLAAFTRAVTEWVDMALIITLASVITTRTTLLHERRFTVPLSVLLTLRPLIHTAIHTTAIHVPTVPTAARIAPIRRHAAYPQDQAANASNMTIGLARSRYQWRLLGAQDSNTHQTGAKSHYEK